MRSIYFSVVLLSGLGSLVAWIAENDPGTSAASSNLRVAEVGCKPVAPIEFQLLGSRIRNGTLEFSYELKPRIDAELLESGIDAGRGFVRSFSRIAAPAVRSGDVFVADARVELPSGSPGGRVVVSAAITFPASDEHGPTGAFETQKLDFAVEWGNAEPVLDGVAMVTSGELVSLDMPAIREGGVR